MVKSEILSMAIREQVKVRFLYGFNEVVLDPYFILFEEDGTKAIYGMSSGSDDLRRFSCGKMANIKLLELHFQPIVPVSPSYN
ncbi:MAG: hypothetical protein HY965_06740 [Ignavibacteriales bacterium]|nr:hypothetical protein [Ignavibacteriales bacterium]